MSKKSKRAPSSIVVVLGSAEDRPRIIEVLRGLDAEEAPFVGIPGGIEAVEDFAAEPILSQADKVVVVMTPRLVAAGWPFSHDAAVVVRRGRVGECELSVILDGVDASGSPLGRSAGAPSGPHYDDESHAKAGERLEGLWALYAADPGLAGLTEAITVATAAWRRGAALRVGEYLHDGRFRLLDRLGQGPLSSTWKARDRQGHELVVVRVLHPHWAADPEVTARFFEGAHRAKGLHHGAIPRVVLDRAQTDGQSYIVSVFQPGETLERSVLDDTTDRGSALQAIVDVASALDAAHAQGVVHHDVRPGNVIIGPLGEGSLIEFEAVPKLPPGGGVYGAPELLDENLSAGPKADVYSLAMTALFALHGANLPAWVLRDPDRLVNKVVASDTVKEAIRRALDWDLEARTPTPEAFVDGLLGDPALTRNLAEKALAMGRHSAASAHLQRLLDLDPTDPKLQILLGRSQARAGDPAKAANTLALALAAPGLQQDEIEGIVGELKALSAETRDYTPLFSAFERAAAANPGQRERWLVERARAVESTDPEGAVRGWMAVLQAHQTRSAVKEARNRLAELAVAREDYSGAVEHLEVLVQYSEGKDLHDVELRIGQIWLNALGDPAKALPWLDRAWAGKSVDPGLPDLLEGLKVAQGDWAGVVALLRERARGRSPQEALPFLVRAAGFAAQARLVDDAEDLWREVLVREPSHPEANLSAARVASRTGHRHALAWWDLAGRDSDPAAQVSDAIVHARLLAAADRGEEAVKRIDEALAIAPGHLEALVTALAERLDRGDHRAALVLAERLREASAGYDSRYIEATMISADLLWLEGDLVGAAARYGAVLEASASAQGGWWGLAKVAWGALRAPERATHLPASRRALPSRIGPQESLAHLLAGLLEPSSMRAWLVLDVRSAAASDALPKDDPLLLSFVVVDTLAQRSLAGPQLFQRLSRAFPAWARPIDRVRAQWFDPASAEPLSADEIMSWSGSAPAGSAARSVAEVVSPLTTDPQPPERMSQRTLHSDLAWSALLHRTLKGQPPVQAPAPVLPPALPRTAVVMSFEGDRQRTWRFDDDRLSIGSGKYDDVRLEDEGLETAHAILYRCDGAFYATCATGMTVDGEATTETRLGDDAVLGIGGYTMEFHVQRPGFEVSSLHTRSVTAPVGRPRVSEGARTVIELPPELPPEKAPAEVPPPNPEGADDVGELELDDDHTGEETRPPPRAALFYLDALGERLIPLVGQELRLQGAEGSDQDEPGEVLWFFRRGPEVFIADPDASAGAPTGRRVKTGERFTLAGRVYELRFLDEMPTPRPVEPPVPVEPAVGRERAHLRAEHGGLVALDRFPFTLGRGRGASHQILTDARLSRVHCQFEHRDGKFYVRDTGSSNGTLVNGQKIHEVQLNHGDRIELGESRYEFRIEDDSSDADPTLMMDGLKMGGRRADEGVAVAEGIEKVDAANQALSILIAAVDEADGPGKGQALVQMILESSAARFTPLIEHLEIRPDGIPALSLMFNLVRRPEAEQRALLNGALLDWVDRSMSLACDAVQPEAVDELLEKVAKVGYRDRLRR